MALTGIHHDPNNPNSTIARRNRAAARENVDTQQVKQLKAAFKSRKSCIDSVRSLANAAAKNVPGVITQVNQMASYNAEALAGEMLTYLIFFIFEMGLPINYLQRWVKINELEKTGIQQGKQYVYYRNINGEFPDIYPLNDKGEPNFNAEPKDPRQVTDDDIIGNGYQLPMRKDLLGVFKQLIEGWEEGLKNHHRHMWGGEEDLKAPQLVRPGQGAPRPGPPVA